MATSNSIGRPIGFLFWMSLMFVGNQAAVFDIKTRGAIGDGIADDGPAIVSAWKEACAAKKPSLVLIPSGTYLVYPVHLQGPCKAPVEILATGATVKAPPELGAFTTEGWITIQNVEQMAFTGGIFDGQGQEAWKTNNPISSRPEESRLPTNLKLDSVKLSLFKDITSLNSKYFHMNVSGCDYTDLERITIDAPEDSVNTGGIHIGRTNGLNITETSIKTGDDCILIGDGSRNLHIDKVTCGRGRGISVGSLGKYSNEEPVEGIWVKNCTMINTTNGVRVETRPGSAEGSASDLHFEDIIMNDVGNPVLVDQEYCPYDECKTKMNPSKIKISSVTFKGIRGTSTTKAAMKLICSKGIPCKNVEVEDIDLYYQGPEGGDAISQCQNINPVLIGQVSPPACIAPPSPIVVPTKGPQSAK